MGNISHADLVVFPAITDHLTTAGKEHGIRGAVPLFDHIQWGSLRHHVVIMHFVPVKFYSYSET